MPPSAVDRGARSDSAAPRHYHRALFPGVGLLLLALLWVVAVFLARNEVANARESARVSATEIAQTYQAQVARALGEIDQTLNLVKYAYEQGAGNAALDALRQRDMLPSDLLFELTLVAPDATVVAGRRGAAPPPNRLQPSDIDALRRTGRLAGGVARQAPGSTEPRLTFARALLGNDGVFVGAAVVTVDAAFFVSSYEVSTMGQRGVLGVIGDDGVFRVRRIGELVTGGTRIDLAGLLALFPGDDAEAMRVAALGDATLRYVAVRRLYGAPLAVVAGLAEDEQLAGPRRAAQIYIASALALSALLAAVVGVLWRLSRQLESARRQEITAAREHSARVEHLAYHDALTGLPNRALFSRLLEQGIAQAGRYERSLAVLFLDLDRFKQVNDTLGHEAGDALLQEVAARLAASVRASDTVARLGGDEFVVLLPETASPQDAAAIAQKILLAVSRPFGLAGQDINVTTSIGIATYPQDGLDEQTLKKNADVAMYRAKEEGKNNYQFYSDRLNAHSLQRLSLEASLRLAVERGEFELHYQAKQDLASGRIAGMEALLRWRHPALGLVAPMQFIPLAEEMGLTTRIGRWVLATACRQNIAWQALGIAPVRISINLTERQFGDERLVADILATLHETGMAPELLELEVREGMLMHDIERSTRILRSLKASGVHIAIDDFGRGYASLAMIQRFPIDTLKIDRAFIRDLTGGQATREVTAAMIAMAKSLSLTVVAQGVESREQAEMLRAQDCKELAGYYFHEPTPGDACATLLRAAGVA